jgi:hypothetical protein
MPQMLLGLQQLMKEETLAANGVDAASILLPVDPCCAFGNVDIGQVWEKSRTQECSHAEKEGGRSQVKTKYVSQDRTKGPTQLRIM